MKISSINEFTTLNNGIRMPWYDADNPDTICLFEIFSDVSDFETANRSEWFAKYQERVKPFIAGPTEVVSAKPIWAKGVAL
jgi:quinol monooxygenase YgiN